MQAQNRTLPQWFNRIESGQIKLPRFQRYEAWGGGEIAGLLETVLRQLPAGAALILEVGDQEKFKSRLMEGAPPPTEKVNEHLLDGQQRLTALWKSLNVLYEDRTYFVYYETDPEDGREIVRVYGQARWLNSGRRFPLWADNAADIHARGYIPLHLLRPGDMLGEVAAWCNAATGNNADESQKLLLQVVKLRELVSNYNIPYLALPVTTPPDVAIDVFVKMNTTAVRLTAFDIVVAQVEAVAGESLHDLVNKLKTSVNGIEHYIEPEDLILNVAAMREDRAPTQASYQRLDLQRLVDDWDALVAGIKWAVQMLEGEHVFDANRLPTVVVLYVLSAIYKFVPAALDARGNARTLIRKYLWRAFLTSRYESAAATAALQDFRGLRAVLTGIGDAAIPIFNEEVYPLPNAEILREAGWPKGRDILGRGVLAISIKRGALDLADGEPATREHLLNREYHHLFPSSLLTGDGNLDESRSFRALNCALVTWNTNRNISAKEPLRYLRERTERAALGESQVRTRLETHLVPFDFLSVGGYADLATGDERAHKISNDYDAFLQARSHLYVTAIPVLCSGADWP
jgi:hypothetical protein